MSWFFLFIFVKMSVKDEYTYIYSKTFVFFICINVCKVTAYLHIKKTGVGCHFLLQNILEMKIYF